MRRTSRTSIIAALAAAMSMIMANFAFADIVYNTLDSTIDATKESIALTVGGGNGTVTLTLTASNTSADGTTTDSKDGCNLGGNENDASLWQGGATGSPRLQLTATSSNTDVATVTNPAAFTKCANDSGSSQTVTVTPVGAGSADITFAINSAESKWRKDSTTRLDSATFTVNVTGDACASVSDPAAPVFSAGAPDGNNGWFTSVPSAAATSSTTGATITYSTDGINFSSTVPTLGQGTTTVTAKATSATCNKTSTTNRSFKVDTVAPAIIPDDVTNTTWRNTTLSQAFTASDGTSGLADTTDASFTLQASNESASASSPTIDSRTVYDNAGNSTTRTLSALIDKTKPTISGAVSPTSPDGNNGWYKTAPTVTFTCGDTLSLILSCLADGETTNSKTLGENANAQSVGGTATDNAGNTETASVTGLKVDLSDPTNVAFVGGPEAGSSHYWGSVPAAPTCTADDAVSGLASCVVTGYSTAKGTHTLTATATDYAGRTDTATRSYTVLGWTPQAFYSPVNMNNVWNTAKGGSTIPLKFEVFAGTTEKKDLADVTSLNVKKASCESGVTTDEIELTSSGSTSLRFDTTGDQFIYNWKTPTGAGCYSVTVTLADGTTSTPALFNLRK